MSNTFHQLSEASKRLLSLNKTLDELYDHVETLKANGVAEDDIDYTEIDDLEVEIENLDAHIADLEEQIEEENSMGSREDFIN